MTLSAMAVMVSLPPAFSAVFAYFCRSFSSSVMSDLSHCVTCGMVAHAADSRSAVMRRMLRIGCTSTSPHWEKSGSGPARHTREATAATGQHRPRVALHVVHGDAAAGTAAFDLRDVHAQLARRAARRGRGRHEAAAAWQGSAGRRCGRGRTSRRAAPDVHDLRRRDLRVFAWRRLGAGQILVLGGSRVGRLCTGALGRGILGGLVRRSCRRSCGSAAALVRRSCASSGGAGGLVHRQHHLPDLHLVARLDLEFLDDAGDAGGHFDRRLVGLELEDGLVLLQGVARLHQHAHDVAAGDILTKFGNDEVSHESPYQPRRQSRRHEGTKARRNWIFRSDNRCAKPSFAPSRLRAFAIVARLTPSPGSSSPGRSPDP